MRDYGKVQTAFWTSGDIQLLSDDGKLLALYLLSSPHTNQIGCFRLPDGYVAEDLKWTNERVSKGFDELLNNGFSNRDAVSKWVIIHKFTKWNEIENPNQAKAAIKLIDQVPDSSSVKPMLVKALREFSPRFLDDFLKKIETVSKGLQEPFRNQEQEQEQEHDQEQEQNTPPTTDNLNQLVVDKNDVGSGALLPHVALSIEFRKHGIQTQPANPKLLALASQGVSVETVEAACMEAKASKPGEQISVNYVIAIIERWSAEATKMQVAGAKPKSRDSPNMTSRHSGFEKLDYSEGIENGRIA